MRAPSPRSRGQIALPALFVFPFLVIVLYMVVETANLSREKIRHQFGVDAAAFAEMSNYSDFLNRAAYINGAFPERVLYDVFYKICIQAKKSNTGVLPYNCGSKGDTLYSILWKNGAFPAWDYEAGLDPTRQEEWADDNPHTDPDWLWKLKFGGCGDDAKNRASPDMDSCSVPHMPPSTLNLITAENAQKYWITWDDAQNAYKLYVEAYTLLGSLVESQREVFMRNAGDQRFYRKSYWMNTGAGVAESRAGADSFVNVKSGFAPKHRCIRNILIFGNKPTGSWSQNFQVFKPGQPMPLDALACEGGPGLFQIETVDPAQLAKLRYGPGSGNFPGISVAQPWEAKVLSTNFFNVDFHREVAGGPCVHATVAVLNPAQGDMRDMDKRNGLWPFPVPKFQTKEYP